MARTVYSTVIIFSIIISLLFGIVFAYYCEWNLCSADQYCCGDNHCCNSVYSLWYFWAGLIILAVMAWSCGGGLLRYCFAVRSQITAARPVASYVPLANVPDDSQLFHPCEDDENFPRETVSAVHGTEELAVNFSSTWGPPPPYTKAPESTESPKVEKLWS